MPLSIIAAVGREREIGFNGKLPWQRIPEDMKHFKDTTENHAVIMGRKTFESIGHPLANRNNIIVTRDPNFTPPPECIVTHSYEEAIKLAGDNEIFVIGGGEIYNQTISLANKMYLTHVDYQGPADTFFPEFDESEWETVVREKHESLDSSRPGFEFVVYRRKSQIPPAGVNSARIGGCGL